LLKYFGHTKIPKFKRKKNSRSKTTKQFQIKIINNEINKKYIKRVSYLLTVMIVCGESMKNPVASFTETLIGEEKTIAEDEETEKSFEN
jgi:hypothetical protein